MIEQYLAKSKIYNHEEIPFIFYSFLSFCSVSKQKASANYIEWLNKANVKLESPIGTVGFTLIAVQQ